MLKTGAGSSGQTEISWVFPVYRQKAFKKNPVKRAEKIVPAARQRVIQKFRPENAVDDAELIFPAGRQKAVYDIGIHNKQITLLCLLLLVPKNMNSRSVFNVGNFDKIMRMQANLPDLRAVDIKRLFAREISF